MSKKTWAPPQKEPCRCVHFCIENTERSGRYCRIQAAKDQQSAATPENRSGN